MEEDVDMMYILHLPHLVPTACVNVGKLLHVRFSSHFSSQYMICERKKKKRKRKNCTIRNVFAFCLHVPLLNHDIRFPLSRGHRFLQVRLVKLYHSLWRNGERWVFIRQNYCTFWSTNAFESVSQISSFMLYIFFQLKVVLQSKTELLFILFFKFIFKIYFHAQQVKAVRFIQVIRQ